MKPNQLITRRTAIIAGVASVGGLLRPGCSKKMPPTYSNLLRYGDNLTYAAHRALLPGQSLAKEYSHKNISSFPATGTTDPGEPGKPKSSEPYRRLKEGGFAHWRLAVESLVARPGNYSLADLKRFPSRTQIIKHVCEEGWTAIGEWTGVPLSRVLDAAGLLPAARFVTFYSYDDWADSIDLLDALHPQTLLAYGMNGRDLPVQQGAPVRLRVERQLGYKSMKYLQRIVVTEDLDDGGEKGNPEEWLGVVHGHLSEAVPRRSRLQAAAIASLANSERGSPASTRRARRPKKEPPAPKRAAGKFASRIG